MPNSLQVKNLFLGQPGCVFNSLPDILPFQIRISLQDLFKGSAMGNLADND